MDISCDWINTNAELLVHVVTDVVSFHEYISASNRTDALSEHSRNGIVDTKYNISRKYSISSNTRNIRKARFDSKIHFSWSSRGRHAGPSNQKL